MNLNTDSFLKARNIVGALTGKRLAILPFHMLYARFRRFDIDHYILPPYLGVNMTENVEDLTVNFEEDGLLIVQEVDKEILSKGSWTTILFRYRDFDKSTQQYSPDKFTIRRYQKRNGQYQTKSKFNISSIAQAEKIVETLSRWINSPET